MKKANISSEYYIYGLLFSLSNRIQKIGDGVFEDMTIKQHFFMLGLFLFQSPPSLKEMADLIGCSYQNIKTMAKNLEEKGFLSIEKSPEDRRRLLLIATDKFEKVADKQKDLSQDFMEGMYRNIPKENVKITFETLHAMDKNLGGSLK